MAPEQVWVRSDRLSALIGAEPLGLRNIRSVARIGALHERIRDDHTSRGRPMPRTQPKRALDHETEPVAEAGQRRLARRHLPRRVATVGGLAAPAS